MFRAQVLQVGQHVGRIREEDQPQECDDRNDEIQPVASPRNCMSHIRQNERDPGKEEIPDQAVCAALSHYRRSVPPPTGYKSDRPILSNTKTAMLCLLCKDEVFYFVDTLRLFAHKIDQVNIARGVTQIRQHGGGFASVLCAVVDHMRHGLPEIFFETVRPASFL